MWSEDDVGAVFKRMRKKARLDAHGVSITFLQLLFLARPTWFCTWIASVAASTDFVKTIAVEARVYGKTSTSPAFEATRSIMPLGALGDVLDALIARSLLGQLDVLWRPMPQFFHGARPGTQCMDIAHTIQVAVEKMLDVKSVGAVLQADVARYYDSISVLLCCYKLLKIGVDKGLVAGLCRLQLMPVVILHVLSATARVDQRTNGSITGTRTAGTLGQIPVESVCRDNAQVLSGLGFQAGGSIITAMSWVDNVYALGRTSSSAMEAMRVIEQGLRTNGLCS